MIDCLAKFGYVEVYLKHRVDEANVLKELFTTTRAESDVGNDQVLKGVKATISKPEDRPMGIIDDDVNKGGEVDSEFVEGDITVDAKYINIRVNKSGIVGRKGNDNGTRVNIEEEPSTKIMG